MNQIIINDTSPTSEHSISVNQTDSIFEVIVGSSNNKFDVNISGQGNAINTTIENEDSDYGIELVPMSDRCELHIYQGGVTIIQGSDFNPNEDYNITGDWSFSNELLLNDGLSVEGTIITNLHGNSEDWHNAYLNSLNKDKVFDKVVGIQHDDTLVPTNNYGDKYIILDSNNLNASFGTIDDIGDNDIVQTNGSVFSVVYDASESNSSVSVIVTEDTSGEKDNIWYYSVSSGVWLNYSSKINGFKPIYFWDFNSDSTGDWTQIGTSLSAPSKSITRYTASNTDPQIYRNININGGQNYLIKIRYKLISGTITTNDLRVYYSTSGHAFSESYVKYSSLIDNSQWNILELDMSELTNGDTDWADNEITSIRFDLGGSNDVVIDIDWITIGKIGWGTQHFEDVVNFGNWITFGSDNSTDEDSGIILKGISGELSKLYYDVSLTRWQVGSIGDKVRIYEALQSGGNYESLNKNSDGWITWATRNIGGSETVIDLSNIGTISSGAITFGNAALISANGGASNIDHIWHDDTNNAWNFVSDGTYKQTGNSAINVGSVTSSGNITGLHILADTYFRSIDNAAVLGTNSSGTVYLRPYAWNDSAYQSEFTTTLATIGTDTIVNGNLGVGISPNYKIHAYDATTTVNIVAQRDDKYSDLQQNSIGGALVLRNNSTVGVLLRSYDYSYFTNNVAIGKTTAEAKLHVDIGTITSETIIAKFNSNYTPTNGYTTIQLGENLGYGNTLLKNYGSSISTISGFGIYNSISDGSYVTALFSYGGAVGIGGTYGSGKRLRVHGDTQLDGTLEINGVEYTWPGSDGTSGYVLSTNGSGQLAWALNTSGSGGTGILSLNGLTTDPQYFASSLPLTIASSGSTHTFSISQANGSTSGYITGDDYTNWESKQSALLGTGIVKSTAGTITYLTDNSTNWNTAYGWGDWEAGVTKAFIESKLTGLITSHTHNYTNNVGTVTSVTAGNGMTQTGTSTVNPTLNIVSHAGTSGSIGTINIGANAIGVNLGTSGTVAAAGNHTHNPNVNIAAFTTVILPALSTYNWNLETSPNIKDATIGTGAVAINIRTASDGMSGMCDFATGTSAPTLTLSTTISGCTAYVDSGADLTLEPSTEYFLTVVRAGNKIKFNLAKYI